MATIAHRARTIVPLLALWWLVTLPVRGDYYVVEDLGLVAPGKTSQGSGISAAGQVAGSMTIPGGAVQAFRSQGANQQLQNLGTLPGGFNSFGYGINSQGQVAGASEVIVNVRGTNVVTMHAFVTNENGRMTDLGTLTGGISSEAFGINSGGQATGYSTRIGDSLDSMMGFCTDANGQLVPLGTLGGPTSQGNAINELGIIAGTSTTSWGAQMAFRYNDETKTMVPLGTLLGGTDSYGLGINDLGQVVGASKVAGTMHAFRTSLENPDRLEDLGTLYGDNSQALDINNEGTIVGKGRISGNLDHAFLWTRQDGMVDLNTLLPPSSQWLLLEAVGINDQGYITGTGLFNNEQRAFRLVPSGYTGSTPAPPTVVLVGIGGLCLSAWRRWRRPRPG